MNSAQFCTTDPQITHKMATIKLYLDARSIKSGEVAPIKIAVTKNGSTAYLGTDVKVLPKQWDKAREYIKDHSNKATLNSYLKQRKIEAENFLLELTLAKKISTLSATELKNLIKERLDNYTHQEDNFTARFSAYIGILSSKRTKEIYGNTLSRIRSFDKGADTLTFEEITKDWLTNFNAYLINLGNATNTISIHLRNIRAVFNDAIDNNITSHYPFRKFKIKNEATLKRSLTIAQLRDLFSREVEPWQQRYVDAFKLTFFLIGINPIDLCRLTEIKAGRIVYKRAKTGRLYSVKVENEALEIIKRYQGDTLLLNFAESVSDYRSFVGKMDKGLKAIGDTIQVENPMYTKGSQKHKYKTKRISAFPNLSIYWARHTWATIAAELDIPDATISEALGHTHGNATTSIYVNFNNKKVDDANRQVMNYVLYGR